MNARDLLETLGLIAPGQEPKNPVKREQIAGEVIYEDELFLSVQNDGEIASYFFLEGQAYRAEHFDQMIASGDLEKALAALTMEGFEE